MTAQLSPHQEAPAPGNVRLYAESGAEVLLTLRAGASPPQAQTLSYAKEKYHLAIIAPSLPLANGNGRPWPKPTTATGCPPKIKRCSMTGPPWITVSSRPRVTARPAAHAGNYR